MDPKYTIGEILKVAEELERNAAAFYRAAARAHPREANQLLALAQIEEKHQAVFNLMERGLHAEVYRRGQGPTLGGRHAYLEVLARASDCEGTEQSESLSGAETFEELLKQGLEKEKHSILFYSGLRGSAAPQDAQTEVDKILAEEMDHMVILARMLQSCVDSAEEKAGRLPGVE